MAYESTTVPVDRSQGEIRKLLSGAGASSFAFAEECDLAGVHWAAVQFVSHGRAVRLRVPLKPVDARAVRVKVNRARTRSQRDIEADLREQEARRIWRVLAWNLKARLVAVEEGVETFEEAFLAHLLDTATGRTIYEQLRDTGAVDLGAPLLLGSGDNDA